MSEANNGSKDKVGEKEVEEAAAAEKLSWLLELGAGLNGAWSSSMLIPDEEEEEEEECNDPMKGVVDDVTVSVTNQCLTWSVNVWPLDRATVVDWPADKSCS